MQTPDRDPDSDLETCATSDVTEHKDKQEATQKYELRQHVVVWPYGHMDMLPIIATFLQK